MKKPKIITHRSNIARLFATNILWTKKSLLTVVFAVIILLPILAQNKRALIVGISLYNPHNIKSSEMWNNIHGANDAKLIKETLRKQGFKINTIEDSKATAQNIRNAFYKLIQETQSGDLVYIHFSGHGQAVEDINGDESDGWDEAIIPIDANPEYSPELYKGGNHILDDELHEFFRSLRKKIGPQGIVYAIIDACHAGSIYRGDEVEDTIYARGTNKGFTFSGKRYSPRIDKRGNILVEKGEKLSDITIIEACRSYEVNTEIKQNGEYFGPLSYYVHKVLSTHSLSKDTVWSRIVANLMDMDKRLIKQHVVIETTK